MTDRTSTTITPLPLPLSLPLSVTPKHPATHYTAPADLPDAYPDGLRLLADRFGRIARDLRVSLTDRCNLRCTYCMPADGLEWIPTDFTLNDDEMIRLIRIGVEKLGIRMVRFTGGEPLLRKNLDHILAATKTLITDEGVAPQTALTTNGVSLARQAQKLADAGLDRVNISLDTIDPELYTRLTRRNRINDVFKAIDAALDAGLNPVKINAVVMPGVNKDGILDLARFALDKGTQLRFIEQMPLGPREEWKRSDMVTAEDIIDKLKQEFELSPAKQPRGSAPAALWNVTNGELEGSIGIIASVTHPFCGDCDRTRLTTDGAIRNCLFASQDSEISLRDLLRAGASDDELARAWAGTMWVKKPGHGIDDEGFLQPDRPMSAIGG
ncbi:GTP 3',8-cyclase MoaA [Corynebacterium cystitidis]|uniref:GTP 3',8-cyclase n=1 Tax=Corynebacterium cystitidis DSM 20524 TaxID=1121357 RepID=A0A1H9S0M2_9CORY|nr:GTP 3',8-cyclase MoaA [Corynebacterium cystitidis]WJY82168.1 Cyclic pyranopterin monophosphate synthase [Corynebacterium cystitidis DSM 20524]SER78596.1 cyclic pyranopterin phosphate synthase [Corynebacterium cystitidis DSM 20524]SNV78302.1 molybdenum cofactor biosynthesis protein A [Corynebacterium cystitidis]